MSFFSKLFSGKQKKSPDVEKKDVVQKTEPRYVVLEDIEGEDEWAASLGIFSYEILDTKENIKLGLRINHEVYNTGAMSHEEEPDFDKNGVSVSVKVVVGDFYEEDDDKKNVFKRSAEVLDKNLQRRATNDDADFALYTQLQEEMKNSATPEQAILLYTLLDAVKSDILTSSSRVTEEYRRTKERERDERKAREQALRFERAQYQKEQRAQELKRKEEKRKAVSDYMQNIRNDFLKK